MGDHDQQDVHKLELRITALEMRIKYGIGAILLVATVLAGFVGYTSLVDVREMIQEELEKSASGNLAKEIATLREQAVTDASAVRAARREACAEPSSVDSYGFCIFHRNPGRYTLNFGAATAACRAEGARLCTLAEVERAHQKKAEWCSWGWVSKRDDKDTGAWSSKTGTIAFPMQSTKSGCGKAGVNVEAKPKVGPGSYWGANCCM